jgi:hypothetical protein
MTSDRVYSFGCTRIKDIIFLLFGYRSVTRPSIGLEVQTTCHECLNASFPDIRYLCSQIIKLYVHLNQCIRIRTFLGSPFSPWIVIVMPFDRTLRKKGMQFCTLQYSQYTYRQCRQYCGLLSNTSLPVQSVWRMTPSETWNLSARYNIDYDGARSSVKTEDIEPAHNFRIPTSLPCLVQTKSTMTNTSTSCKTPPAKAAVPSLTPPKFLPSALGTKESSHKFTYRRPTSHYLFHLKFPELPSSSHGIGTRDRTITLQRRTKHTRDHDADLNIVLSESRGLESNESFSRLLRWAGECCKKNTMNSSWSKNTKWEKSLLPGVRRDPDHEKDNQGFAWKTSLSHAIIRSLVTEPLNFWSSTIYSISLNP